MVIYLSLPITGYDEIERRATCEIARTALHKQNHIVVSPFDIADCVEQEIVNPVYGDYMAVDIRFILNFADAVCFLVDPLKTESKGVRFEYECARIYGKMIFIETFAEGQE